MPTATRRGDLYIELLTRVTGQSLAPNNGDEKAALDSIHALFPLTRDILHKHGPGCGQFAKLAIPVLNQIVRPFAAKWHQLSLAECFKDETRCAQFREALAALQAKLECYTQALGKMADVEDFTKLESA